MVNSVLIIIHELIYGGAERYILNLTNALVGKNIKVTIISDAGPLVAHFSPKVKIYLLPMSIKSKLKQENEKRILEIATAIKPQVIHTQDRTSLASAQLARNKLNIPLVTHVHRMYNSEEYPIIVNELKEGADKIITLGPYTAKDLIKYGLDRKKIIPISAGIDPQLILPITKEERENARKRLKLNYSDKVVVCLSRIVAEKGIDKLTLGFVRVVEKIPNAKLLIVGDEDKEPIKAHIRKIVKENKLRGKVILYRGDYDIRKYHAAADVFCHPSLTKGLSVMEAMAAGLPIVGKETKRKPLVVENKISGLMTKNSLNNPINPDYIAEKLIYLLNHPKLSKKMGVAGRLKIEKKFNIDIVLKNILKTYEEVIFLHSIQNVESFYSENIAKLSNDTVATQYSYKKIED